VTVDFDKELAVAMRAAAKLYGEPDKRFTIKPVQPHTERYAQAKVDPNTLTVTVHVSELSLFPDPDAEAKYQLWHEAVHCLFPVNRMDTLWFEEGVALRFALKHTPISPKRLKANRAALQSPWKDVYRAFTAFNPSDAQIREIRNRAPEKLLDNVTAKIVTDVCKVRYKVCAPLFQRLSATDR